jgi:hypothetical protein
MLQYTTSELSCLTASYPNPSLPSLSVIDWHHIFVSHVFRSEHQFKLMNIFNKDVTFRYELPSDVDAFLRLEVESKTSLVPIYCQKIRRFAIRGSRPLCGGCGCMWDERPVAETFEFVLRSSILLKDIRSPITRVIAFLGYFNLDHVGSRKCSEKQAFKVSRALPEIGQIHGTARPCQSGGKV